MELSQQLDRAYAAFAQARESLAHCVQELGMPSKIHPHSKDATEILLGPCVDLFRLFQDRAFELSILGKFAS